MAAATSPAIGSREEQRAGGVHQMWNCGLVGTYGSGTNKGVLARAGFSSETPVPAASSSVPRM